MRSDYALYVVAVIFFILTGIVLAYQIELKELWVVTTAILGLLFVGLGYTQKPKPHVITVEAHPRAPAPEMPTPPPINVVTEEKMETVMEVAPPKAELTKVKGIGEKRVQQLQALGISSVEHLANASAKDLAEKLKISPKITGRWIENAKNLAEKS
jgi:predicted flap endonuclease-1-like 5' DNA nuclease